MQRICDGFADRYGTASAEFFERYKAGEFVGSHDAARWAGFYRVLLRLNGQASPDVVVGGTIDKDIDKDLYGQLH